MCRQITSGDIGASAHSDIRPTILAQTASTKVHVCVQTAVGLYSRSVPSASDKKAFCCMRGLPCILRTQSHRSIRGRDNI